MEQPAMSLCIFKSAIFLLSIFHCTSYCNCCVEEEMIALLQIKDFINYPFGSSLDHDWVGKDCCNWSGIECNQSSSRVVAIDLFGTRDSRLGTWYPNATLFAQFKELNYLDLSSNNIGGWLMPQAFSEMQHLQYLSLSYNNLNDKIDSLWGLCELKNLQTLHLVYNNLDGRALPPCVLSNLSMLEELYLGDNNLGSSPGTLTGLCGLRALRNLSLELNNLNSLPMCLGNLSMLEILYLAGNNFSGGSFGNWIQGFKRLDVLDLSSNRLTDESISPWIFNLTSLTELSLINNQLRDSNTVKGLCKLRALRNLDLGSNNINSLPICLGNLSMLEELYLAKTDLTEGSFGTSIQGLCGLEALETLDLNENKIKSLPMCLGSLPMLQQLDLSENNLTAISFGNSMPGLKRLDYLDLSSNGLTDESISPWISSLTSLSDLDLSNNQLKDSNTLKDICRLSNLKNLYLSMTSIAGNIQSCLGAMNNIRVLSLSQNQFSGLISFSIFANLSELSYIDLSYNTELEVETERPSWIPTFQLSFLDLRNFVINKLSGGNIPTFISTQWELEYLDLTHTFLRGTIPSWLLYNVTTGRVISMRQNFLEGPFPRFAQHNSSKVVQLDISTNNISGMLLPTIGALLPNLFYLNMSKNFIKGNIPLSLSEMKDLKTLDLSENMFSGEIPHSLTRNGSFLEYLSLSNNGLWGEILLRDSNMTQLLVLALNGNSFSGSIPSSLLSSPLLRILDVGGNKLSGAIPSWLYSLINLTSLLLGGNSFDGPIPTELCQMQNLHMLDLSHNDISGTIPSCFNNITSWKEETPIQIDFFVFYTVIELFPFSSLGFNIRVTTDFTVKGMKRTYEGLPFMLMTGIDLSMNQLIGDIPFQIGELKELRSLNLSNNILSGPFPNTFQNLENIESLDLSHNTLVGTIPSQIIQLHSLSAFSVAFNNLSGIIPYEKQFSTFNDNSYMGNPGLCGLPLQRNCSSNILPSSQDKNAAKEDSGILYSPMFFYSWITFSFALGFWGFIALLFKNNFRRKLFKIVDGCYDYGHVQFQLFVLYLKNDRL